MYGPDVIESERWTHRHTFAAGTSTTHDIYERYTNL